MILYVNPIEPAFIDIPVLISSIVKGCVNTSRPEHNDRRFADVFILMFLYGNKCTFILLYAEIISFWSDQIQLQLDQIMHRCRKGDSHYLNQV